MVLPFYQQPAGRGASCELGLQLLVTQGGSGDAPAADPDSIGGGLLFNMSCSLLKHSSVVSFL